MSNLVRKEIHGIFRTKNPIKDQIRKYKRREKELDPNSTATFVYVRSDLLSRIINCRGEKTRGEKKKKKKKKFNQKCLFFLLIYLHLHSSSFYTRVT